MNRIVSFVGQSAQEMKKTVMNEITEAVARNCGVQPEAVIVESSRDNKSKGGVPFSER